MNCKNMKTNIHLDTKEFDAEFKKAKRTLNVWYATDDETPPLFEIVLVLKYVDVNKRGVGIGLSSFNGKKFECDCPVLYWSFIPKYPQENEIRIQEIKNEIKLLENEMENLQ